MHAEPVWKEHGFMSFSACCHAHAKRRGGRRHTSKQARFSECPPRPSSPSQRVQRQQATACPCCCSCHRHLQRVTRSWRCARSELLGSAAAATFTPPRWRVMSLPHSHREENRAQRRLRTAGIQARNTPTSMPLSDTHAGQKAPACCQCCAERSSMRRRRQRDTKTRR